MTDFFTSVIRTVVPMIVGAVVTWLATHGVKLDPGASAGLGAFLTALFGGLYYFVVRLVERYYPQAGILLGAAKKPTYDGGPK